MATTEPGTLENHQAEEDGIVGKTQDLSLEDEKMPNGVAGEYEDDVERPQVNGDAASVHTSSRPA